MYSGEGGDKRERALTTCAVSLYFLSDGGMTRWLPAARSHVNSKQKIYSKCSEKILIFLDVCVSAASILDFFSCETK